MVRRIRAGAVGADRVERERGVDNRGGVTWKWLWEHSHSCWNAQYAGNCVRIRQGRGAHHHQW